MTIGRRSLTRLTLLLSLLGAMLVVAAPASASDITSNSAAGFLQSTTPAGTTRSFAFAVHSGGGGVAGTAFVNGRCGSLCPNNPNTGLTFTLSLRCFSRQGNEALIGGVVTATNNPTNLGWSYVFGIEDNPDIVTFTLTDGDTSPTLTCDNALSVAGEPTLDSFVHDFTPPSVIQEAVTMFPSG